MRSLDRETAERMLDGRVAPDDAPPGYGVVARVVAVLRSAGGDEAVDRRLGAGAALAGSAGRSGFRLRVAALTAVMGGTVLFGLAGAGALPGPVQGVAASVLEKVGVKVPGGEDATNDDRDGAVTPSVVTPGTAKAGTAGAGGSAGTGVAGSSRTVNGSNGSNGATGSNESDGASTGEKNGNTGRNPNAATPATPATPADPGTTGEGATPATPADPATPAQPTHPTQPTQPTQPTKPTLPDQAQGPAS